MQTVRVTGEEPFSDRQFYRESPLKTDKIALNIFDFEPWQALPMHRHPGSDTILLAVRGDGTMFMRDKEFPLEESEAVYVPRGERHDPDRGTGADTAGDAARPRAGIPVPGLRPDRAAGDRRGERQGDDLPAV
ncbi:MAG: Cupin domain protein [Methanocella sp. PtaU1.Bin125]|nr:MAG: Cupin domain protein [Methanocella sp. PtaU1.Bin125]